MKKKIITVLGMAACMALLFGCGQKEAEGTAAVPQTAETREAAGQEPVPEKQGNTQVEIVTPGDVETEKETQEEQNTIPVDSGSSSEDSQIEGFTLDEMIEKMSLHSIYAVKKGDLFYPIEGNVPECGTREEDGAFLCVNYNGTLVNTADFSQGDEVVLFANNDYFYVAFNPVVESGYCIPVIVEKKGESIEFCSVDTENSYVDGDTTVKQFDEYGGNLILGSRNCGIIAGDKDEILEIGGYEGTLYKSARYKCNGMYFWCLEKEALVLDQYQMTDKGYAILSSKEFNPLENGLYMMSIYGPIIEIK